MSKIELDVVKNSGSHCLGGGAIAAVACTKVVPAEGEEERQFGKCSEKVQLAELHSRLIVLWKPPPQP